MRKYLICFLALCAVLVFTVSVVCNVRDRQAIAVLSTSMWKLEPETPQDLDDPPYGGLPGPTKILPADTVAGEGREIALRYAYKNPDWKRQAYKSYWHSSYGRWSYVPNRIHTAMHRIFVTYPTASAFYDFIHDLGIAEESGEFQISTPNPHENIVLVVMQTKTEKIFTLGNQVVVWGRPSPTGLEVFLIPVRDLKPDDPKEAILFQLVTNEGDEMDRTNEISVRDADVPSH